VQDRDMVAHPFGEAAGLRVVFQCVSDTLLDTRSNISLHRSWWRIVTGSALL
jgi:hypothetical protein